MFKQFRTYLPTIKAQDGNNIILNDKHLKKYLNEEIYQNVLSLTPEEKEIWFKMNVEYGDLLKKLLGTRVMEQPIIHEQFILHEAAKSDDEAVLDNILLIEYMEWLKNQE